MSGAKEAKQLVELLRARNPDVKVEKGKGGHWHVKRGGTLLGTIPATPSDFRSLANSKAYFRKEGLVVDTPQAPPRPTGPFGSLPRDAEQTAVAEQVRDALAKHGWGKLKFGTLVRDEAIRLGMVVPSTNHSSEITVGNLLKGGKRVSDGFLDATRAALRALEGTPDEKVETPIEPTPAPAEPTPIEPEPIVEPEPVLPEPPVEPEPEPRAPEPVAADEWLDSLAARVLVRMAMGATTDRQRDEAVALARAVWKLERTDAGRSST